MKGGRTREVGKHRRWGDNGGRTGMSKRRMGRKRRRRGRRKEGRKESECASKNKNPTLRMWGIHKNIHIHMNCRDNMNIYIHLDIHVIVNINTNTTPLSKPSSPARSTTQRSVSGL